jgi:hypothetical protein
VVQDALVLVTWYWEETGVGPLDFPMVYLLSRWINSRSLKTVGKRIERLMAAEERVIDMPHAFIYVYPVLTITILSVQFSG